MFLNESSMVEQLYNHFNKYPVYKEIGVGYGISDLIVIRNRKALYQFLIERNGVYLNHIDQIKIFDYIRRRQGVSFDQIFDNHFISKKRLKYFIIKYLLECGAIYKSNDDYYRNPNFRLFCPKVMAIEAKLQNWKQGLAQAIRYYRFASKSYLALDHDNIHRVDVKELNKYNIGLISVGDKVKFIINPNDKQPVDPIMRYMVSEQIIASNGKLNIDGSIGPAF